MRSVTIRALNSAIDFRRHGFFNAPAVQRMHVDCVSVFETALRNSIHQCKYELMSNGVCISAVSAGLELYGTADWLSGCQNFSPLFRLTPCQAHACWASILLSLMRLRRREQKATFPACTSTSALSYKASPFVLSSRPSPDMGILNTRPGL